MGALSYELRSDPNRETRRSPVGCQAWYHPVRVTSLVGTRASCVCVDTTKRQEAFVKEARVAWALFRQKLTDCCTCGHTGPVFATYAEHVAELESRYLGGGCIAFAIPLPVAVGE